MVKASKGQESEQVEPTKKVAKPAGTTKQAAAPFASAREESPRGPRKIRTGIVVSDRMMQTAVVRVDRLVRHPFYPRTIRSSNKFLAQNDGNTAKLGDVVKIMETRPLSKTKRWRVVEIVRRGSTAPEIPGAGTEQEPAGS